MRGKRAFTLIELIISMALLAIVLISFYPIIITTNKVNHASQNTLIAETLAQSSIEEVLFQVRDKTQSEFTLFFAQEKANLEKVPADHSNFKVKLNLLDTQGKPNLMSVAVEKDDKVIYETEVWLRYER